MKMSKSEKIALIVLCVVLIGILYYQFVFKGQVKKLDDLKAQKDTVEQQLTDIETKIAQMPAKSKKYEELLSQVQNDDKSIYPVISQERLIPEIDALLKGSSLDGSITFTKKVSTKPQLTQDMINGSKTNTDSKDNTANSTDNTSTSDTANTGDKTNTNQKVNANDIPAVENMNMELAVSGSYENILKFIDSVQNYSRNIVVPKITLSSQGGGTINAAISLEFYAVQKVTNDDYGTKWDLNGTYGKPNPFN